MNKILFFVCFAFALFNKTAAQHCPFDGSAIVVIKLTDKKGNAITSLKDSITLYEINNPSADSCSFAKGLLSIPFNDLNKALINKYDNSWLSWAQKYSAGCAFMNPGYFAVVLNQAEESCMIEKGSDYSYHRREFEVRLKKGEALITLARVPSEKIYSLCTGAGAWNRIMPVEIFLEN